MIYFVWWTVFRSQNLIFGYSESLIVTYILTAALIRAIVLSSRVMDVASQIAEGNIVNFLIKPINFIAYYFVRDISDKLLNISFVIVEIFLIIFFLNPQIHLQKDPLVLFLFLLSLILGLILYFCISFTFGLLAFWLENIWGIFFLFFMLVEGFGGGLFPIDIMPQFISNILLLTPFPYLIYFPAKIYLGGLSDQEVLKGFIVLIFWLITAFFIMIKTLKMGFKRYTAVGH